MAQADAKLTVIRLPAENPLDRIIHDTARKLLSLRMAALANGEPTKGEAQAFTRDLLDIAKIVDDGLLALGREARSHFGNSVSLEHFTDQLRGSIEGNAAYEVCAAVEAMAEEFAADDRWRDFPPAA